MIVKIQFEGKVKRIYEEQRGQYTHKYVVVSDDGGKYENVLRFQLKPDFAVNFAEGAFVKVSAYVNGREWTNSQGQVMYFIDLKVDTVEVVSNGSAAPTAAPAATPTAAKPTTAADWPSLLALAQAYGEDQTSVISFCKATHPGKQSNTYGAAEWQAVADAIVKAHTVVAAPPPFADEMPF